jgi:Bacterial dnaA protein helix-turn-helix
MKLIKHNVKAGEILADAKMKLQQLLGVAVQIEVKPLYPLDKVEDWEWLQDVSEVLHVSPEDMKSKSRKREIVKARHLAMYFLYKYSSRGYQDVASVVGLSDHTSAVHSVNAVQDALHVGDPDMTDAHYLVYKQMRKYAAEVESF